MAREDYPLAALADTMDDLMPDLAFAERMANAHLDARGGGAPWPELEALSALLALTKDRLAAAFGRVAAGCEAERQAMLADDDYYTRE